MDLIFLQLSGIPLSAAMVGILCQRLGQPVFLGYVVTGLAFAALMRNSFTDPVLLHTFGELGLTFLLFLVGLELNVTDLRRFKAAIVVTTFLRTLVVASCLFFISQLLNLDTWSSIYVALSGTFASTAINLKTLTDNGGQGSLIFTSLGESGSSHVSLAERGILACAFVSGIVLATRFVIPKLFKALAQSQDLLLLGSIGWCVFCAALAQLLGLSAEVGAFLAGISLSSTSFHYQIAARVRTLRDFFLSVFFIVLGLESPLQNLIPVVIPGLILAVLVIVLNTVMTGLILGRLGYKRHTAFFTAIHFGQAGELALVLMALGLHIGHIQPTTATLMTLTVILSLLVSSYAVNHADRLYKALRPYLAIMGNASAERRIQQQQWDRHVVILGGHRLGGEFLRVMRRLHAQIIVIDEDPAVVARLEDAGVSVIYGDGTDDEVLREAHVNQARLVISTLEHAAATTQLLARTRGLAIQKIVTAPDSQSALTYYRQGADYVIVPKLLGAQAVATLIEDQWGDPDMLSQTRLKHVQMLALRHLTEAA
jgi:Kef-type K+ transport system membrane component KefB